MRNSMERWNPDAEVAPEDHRAFKPVAKLIVDDVPSELIPTTLQYLVHVPRFAAGDVMNALQASGLPRLGDLHPRSIQLTCRRRTVEAISPTRFIVTAFFAC